MYPYEKNLKPQAYEKKIYLDVKQCFKNWLDFFMKRLKYEKMKPMLLICI